MCLDSWSKGSTWFTTTLFQSQINNNKSRMSPQREGTQSRCGHNPAQLAFMNRRSLSLYVYMCLHLSLSMMTSHCTLRLSFATMGYSFGINKGQVSPCVNTNSIFYWIKRKELKCVAVMGYSLKISIF